jgi:uncharacterized protein (TIGR02266 family)
MQAIETDQADVSRQAQRAAELLDLALGALNEEPANGNALREVAQRVDEARSHLEKVVLRDGEWRSAVVSSNRLLNDALALAGGSDSLPPRQAQSLEAIARSQALIYPIALQHGGEDAKPPPIPKSRRNDQHSLPPGAERRRSPRAVLATDVTFESTTNFFTGYAEDLSDGGIFVATYNLQPIGTAIELSFNLPDGHVVHAKGQVRWLRDPRDENLDAPPGMGIMFESLLPEDLEAVHAFIQARAPIFYDE